MITVAILINGQPIYTRTAVNVKTVTRTVQGEVCEYKLDDGTILTHNRKDGQ